MKNSIWRTVCLVLSLVVFASSSYATTWAYRSTELSHADYRQLLHSRPDLKNPIDFIRTKLDQTELSESIQNQLDGILILNADDPTAQCLSLQKFAKTLRAELQNRATKSLIEKILLKCPLQKATSSLRVGSEHFDPLLVTDWWKHLREQTGGEDLVVFFDGRELRFHDGNIPTEVGQWLFVSSQFQPLILEGSWNEIKNQVQFKNWVSGTCANYRIVQFDMNEADEHVAFFSESCPSISRPQDVVPVLQKNPTEITNNKKWLYGGFAAVALGALALSLSGKKLKFHFNH